jgi:hypothetical protein
MNNHLTEDQFAKSAVDQSTAEERKHLAECKDCSGELSRLRSSIALFQSALQNTVDIRLVSRPPLCVEPAGGVDSKWSWALVAATALVLALVPCVGPITLTTAPPLENSQAESDADVLMHAVNLQLSRTVPTPLEPVIALLPADELPVKSGGVQ